MAEAKPVCLLYLRTGNPSAAELQAQAALRARGYRVRNRNARLFRESEMEPASLVVTSSERVRAAYRCEVMDMAAVTEPEAPEPEPEAPAVYHVKPKGGGWYNVEGPMGTVNDSGLREDAAIELAGRLNAGGA